MSPAAYLYGICIILAVLIAIAVIRGRRRSNARSLDAASLQGEMATRPSGRTIAPPPSDEAAIALARQGKKIEAIKMIRELHRIGLAEAKHWVEAAMLQPPGSMQPGSVPPGVGASDGRTIGWPLVGGEPLAGGWPGGDGAAVGGGTVGGAASDEAAIALALSGKKIEAIKMIRQLHGIGLKEAKMWVEEAVRVRGGR